MKRIVFLVPDDTRPHVMERMDEVADECGLDPCWSWMEEAPTDEQREQRALAAWHGERCADIIELGRLAEAADGGSR